VLLHQGQQLGFCPRLGVGRHCFPGRGRLQQTLTRRGDRVFLAGDYLGTLYTETAISSGLSAAQEVRSLLATDRQTRRRDLTPTVA
jgi:oxygen-dependent protoporphyrinogen oxidase